MSPEAGAMASAAAQALPAPDTIVIPIGASRHGGVGELVPQLTIGVVEGAEEYTFGEISTVLPLRDGSFLVVEASLGSEPRVRKYDAQGRFERAIGRFGDGPGEYRGPSGFAELPDGRLVILDAPRRRMNVYSPAGDPVEGWPLGRWGFSTGLGNRILGSSRAGVYVRSLQIGRGAGGEVLGSVETILRISPEGEIVESVAAPELRERGGGSVTVTRTSEVGTASSTFDVPYSPRAVWGWSPLGYMVTGLTDRFVLDLRVAPGLDRTGAALGSERATPPPAWREGDPVVSLRRPAEPISVPDAERRARAEDLEARVRSTTGVPDGPIPEIPSRKPIYKQILFSMDGDIWVSLATPSERFDPPDPAISPPPRVGIGRAGGRGAPPPVARGPLRPPVPWREPTVYEIVAPSGVSLGRVAVPYDTRVLAIRGETVWGVTRGEYDVPLVVSFGIRW
jgi:hypothetical protein